MGYGAFGRACLFILGAWWCWEVTRRLRSDIAEFRTADLGGRVILAGVWLASLAIVYVMTVHFAIPAARAIQQFL